jgi:hypothetical protein
LEKRGFEPWRELVNIAKSPVDFPTPQWVNEAEQLYAGLY